MEYIERFFKLGAGYFVDSQHAVTKRVGVGLLVLGLGFLIDDQIGFTFYYATQQKIVQAEKLSAIIRADTTDVRATLELKMLRLRILQRKGFVSHLWDLTKSAINSRSIQTKNASPASIIDSRRNIVLHVLSSSWMLIIISAVGFVGLLLQPKIGGNEIAGMILLAFMIVGLAFAFSFVFSYIPIIAGNAGWNYALNAFLHFLIVVLIVRVISKKTT